MTLLNPTPEELRARQEKRLQDLAERTERWRKRRRRMFIYLMIAGGLVFPVGCWIASAGGGKMTVLMWPYAALGGAALAGIIGYFSLGLLRGMLLYGLGCFVLWFLGMCLGWWQLSREGTFMLAGPVILMICSWLAWCVAGAVFGLISDTFDSDTSQV